MLQLIKDVIGAKPTKKVKEENIFNFPIVDIKDISKDINGWHKLILNVSPINGSLLSDDDLEAVCESIQGALNSFEGRIGIYIQSERIDIEKNINNIEAHKKKLNSELKIMILEEQKEDLKRKANKSRNVLNFYITLESREKDFAVAQQLLNDAFISMRTELEASEMYVNQLLEKDFKNLLYTRMNPEQSEFEPLRDDWDIENILPQNARIYSDGRHIEIENDIYRFFSISKIPDNVDKYRWLRKIFNIKGSVYIAITLTPKNKAKIQKELSKAVNEVGAKKLGAVKDKAKEQQYKAEEESAIMMIQELGSDNISLYDTNITIGICEKDMKSLNTLANSLRAKISSTYCQSTEIKYKGFDPFFTTLPILPKNKITDNYVWNLSTKDIASIIPFDSSEFMEEKGTLIGNNFTSNGLIIANYRNRNYNNSHMCILADSGSGKTWFIKTDVIRNIPYTDYQIIFDIKGDIIFPWGKRHTFSATSGLISNPFHIRNAIIDTESDYEQGKVDVGLFLAQKIMDVIVFFKWIIPNMTPYDESLLEEDIRDAYRKCGLDFDSKELPKEFCTMSTLEEIQTEKIENSKSAMERERREYIKACLRPYTLGVYATMFNGQTNWEFDFLTVFDISNVPEAVMKPLYDILLKDTWQFAKKDGTTNPTLKDIYVDECHEFADPKNPQTLVFLSTKLSKQGRGFGVRLVTATQNLPDFLSIPRYGQAIIDNSYFKIFFRLGETDLPVAKKLYNFSEAEMKVIGTTNKKGNKGKGIFIVGSQRNVLQTTASKFELEIIDPKQFKELYNAESRYIKRALN